MYSLVSKDIVTSYYKAHAIICTSMNKMKICNSKRSLRKI